MTFNAKKVKEKLIKWLAQCFECNGKDCKAVIGISGGKDSTIAAALCVEALGKERVIGVLMPNGVQQDIEDSKALCKHLNIKNFEVNIKVPYDDIITQIDGKVRISEQTKINLAPRLRMSTLYAVAQSVNGRVINTSNISEAWVGYSTRYGDSVGDFAPLLNLTATELIEIGKELNLPLGLVIKTPADGLSSKSDAETLGFTYAALDKYIRTAVCEDTAVKERINSMHEKNEFKRNPMPAFKYEG